MRLATVNNNVLDIASLGIAVRDILTSPIFNQAGTLPRLNSRKVLSLPFLNSRTSLNYIDSSYLDFKHGQVHDLSLFESVEEAVKMWGEFSLKLIGVIYGGVN